MAADSSRPTTEVFDDHLERARRGDVEGDLERNYAPDVVVLSVYGVHRGHVGTRELADLLERQLPSAQFDYTLRLVEGDVALLEWTATADGARVEDGVDTFVVRDGRIVAQTIHYTVQSGRRPPAQP
jgi:hypothetical protein